MYLQIFENGIERIIECDEVIVGKEKDKDQDDAIRFKVEKNGLETTVILKKGSTNVYLLSNMGKTINSWDMS